MDFIHILWCCRIFWGSGHTVNCYMHTLCWYNGILYITCYLWIWWSRVVVTFIYPLIGFGNSFLSNWSPSIVICKLHKNVNMISKQIFKNRIELHHYLKDSCIINKDNLKMYNLNELIRDKFKNNLLYDSRIKVKRIIHSSYIVLYTLKLWILMYLQMLHFIFYLWYCLEQQRSLISFYCAHEH